MAKSKLQSLRRPLTPVELGGLICPRIEITRMSEDIMGLGEDIWTVKAVGFNGGVVVEHSRAYTLTNALELSEILHAQLQWPIVKLRMVLETRMVTEFDEVP